MKIKTQVTKLYAAMKNAPLRPLLATTLCSSVLAPVSAIAQEAQGTDVPAATEVIEVRGVRGTIQETISIKKESTTIVDGLSAADIGDLPAMSIGEALETLTGASSHREQGGATEISVRGLGPYLGSTVFNGREASNGSGDRSVNFSQFPSELFNKIGIFKTQEASLIEGGVSGQIALETVKPLDFGKQRFQADYKLNYNPNTDNIEDPVRDYGHRLTLSMMDQFEFDSIGEIGVSVGYQKQLANNPEQEARTTSLWRDCIVDPTSSDGVYSTGNCDGGDLEMEIDPDTGEAPDADADYVFVPSGRSYRQNLTDDDRESLFMALQWRPNDVLDFNFDIEVADRTFTEVRNDLTFAENRRIDAPDVDDSEHLTGDLIYTNNGALRQYTNEQRIETHSMFLERIEEYRGGGLEVEYQATDTLTISADLSYSNTFRQENIMQTRLQSEGTDIYGNDVEGADSNGRIETRVDIFQNGSEIHNFTVQNFDVNNHDNYADALRTRLDLNQYRDNTITAFRTDFDYIPDMQSIVAIKGGLRVSNLEFSSVPRVRDEFTADDSDIAEISNACRNESFPESGFLSAVRGSQALITNVDDNENVIAEGTGNTYATFDAKCLAREVLAKEGIDSLYIPGPEKTISNVNVEEQTIAAYLQADFDTDFMGYFVRGNFGVRVINTETTSWGWRGELTAVYDTDGILSSIDVDEDADALYKVSGGSSYTEVLPSVNVVVDLDDDILVRGAIYRALSRPNPSDLGYGRSFSGLSANDDGTLEDAIGLAVANGNPNLEAMTSWNIDTAVEWYPNDDTILAFGLYYKSFQGGFENSSEYETFTVDGEDLTTLVTTSVVSDDTSTIYGAEFTASHSLEYLDNWLSGFGIKFSYNYAESDFEYEDSEYGASSVYDGDTLVDRVGLVDPANVPGFSKHVLATQLYYQYEGLNISLNYKYRSSYFQQYVSTPGYLRYIGDTGVWETKASYRMNRNLKFSLSVINLFDEPKKQYNPMKDNFGEINVYGSRVYAGIQYRY